MKHEDPDPKGTFHPHDLNQGLDAQIAMRVRRRIEEIEALMDEGMIASK